MSGGRGFRDLSDEDIQGLVDSLNSLREGELGIDMLVACGERAIEPLRRFLFEGRPRSVFVAAATCGAGPRGARSQAGLVGLSGLG